VKIICQQPSREREDDRVVEMFLQAHEQGRFSHAPTWLPQNRKNVEVIATASDGTRLAIEHTRIFAFNGHMEQEKLLRPIAERLEAISLPGVSGKWFQLRFKPHFIGRRLRRHLGLVQHALVEWATSTLPTIPARQYFVHTFHVPIPLQNVPVVEIDVEVWGGMEVMRPICVSGWLPQGRRLDAAVKHALKSKLQKLADAEADVKFLMIDMPTHSDSDIAIANIISDAESEFPLLAKVDEIVFAKTFSFTTEGCIFFRRWNPKARRWSEFLQACRS